MSSSYKHASVYFYFVIIITGHSLILIIANS